MIKYFTIEDLLKHYLQKKFHILANLVQQLVSKNMIDKYYISVIPTLLGNGVRLLGNIDREIKLRLCKTQTYNGITDLIYMRR